MRSWKALFLVGCLALLPTSARAAVSALGFSHTALGAADVSASPDERRLPVRNLGSSGEDGVSISLGRMCGHACTIDHTFSDADAGTVLRYSYRWTVSPPDPVTPQESLIEVVLAIAVGRISVSTTHRCNAPQQVVEVLDHGVVVQQYTVDQNTPITIDSPPPGEPDAPLPIVSSTIDAAHERLCTVIDLQRTGQVRAQGTFGDGRVIRVWSSTHARPAIDEGTFLDDMRLTCACPPGSSLDGFDVVSEACDRFHAQFSSTGVAHFHGTDGLLQADNLGSSGQDGVRIELSHQGRLLDGDDKPVSGCVTRFSDLSFDPALDQGASFVWRVLSVPVSSCGSNAPVVGRLATTCSGDELVHQYDFSGMCAGAESVTVINAGARGPRQSVSLDGTFNSHPPPGSASKLPRTVLETYFETGDVPTADQFASLEGAQPTVSSQLEPGSLLMRVDFGGRRVFDLPGGPLVGDQLEFKATHGGGGGGGSGGAIITIVGSNFGYASSSTGAGNDKLQIAGVHVQNGTEVRVEAPPSACLSSTQTSLRLPVVIDRTYGPSAGSGPVRAFSVTLQLGPELELAGPVTEGTYLSRYGQTQMYVLDNGDGSITVDCTILGAGCGPTDNGELFTMPVRCVRPPGASSGRIRVTDVQLRDCTNADVAVSAGEDAVIGIDENAPSPVSSLSAVQRKTGNDGSGRTGVVVSYTLSDATSDVCEVYRAPYGNYPEYDDAPNAGAPPAVPSYPPGTPWTLTQVHASGDVDVPPSRDFWYYVAFEKDACGNTATASSVTGGTLDYHLGDVSDGSQSCAGDNVVTTADVSLLGAHYGATLTPGSAFACLDVGPTTNRSVDARPLTDNRLNFEDLVVFGLNFSLVSAPAASLHPIVAAATDAVRLAAPALPPVGQTFDVGVQLDGAGDVQALSTRLAWDPAVVEPVGTSAGALADEQNRQAMVIAPEPGVVDATLLGTGSGFAGSGDLARVTFRVKAAGDPHLAIAQVTARDQANHDVRVGGATDAGPVAPARTALGIAFPNPFARSTSVVMSLRSTGPATLHVFDVAGRHVRTLLSGVQPAGTRTVSWDGRDDAGAALGAGVYLMRLTAGERVETRTVRLVK